MALCLIEKELKIRAWYEETWQLFCAAPTGIDSAVVHVPILEIVAKGTPFAGMYYYGRRFGVVGKIEINSAYFDCESECSVNECKEIIAHELAHHLVINKFPKAKQAHGPEFRWIMNSIGYRGDTYHKFSVSKAKAVAVKHKNELIDLG